MSAPLPDPNPDDPADDPSHRHALRILRDAGIAIVQDLQHDPATTPADKAEPFERLARAVRRTILLDRHLALHPSPAAQAAAQAAAKRTLARKRIIREVEDAIAREARCSPRAETLRHELRERLDAPDLDHDIAHRPIDEVIRDIRRDLGLDTLPGQHAWARRTPAAARALDALAAAPAGAATRLPLPPNDPPPENATENAPENAPGDPDDPDELPADAPAAVLAILRARRHRPDG